MKRIGMNTAIRERLIETTVKLTSRAPSSAAWNGRAPRSMWRETFSSTTIASSTTKPVAMVSAMSDRLFRLKPARYITPNVATSETGTATAGIRVARPLRRNRNTTMITSAIAMTRVLSTSRRDARMVLVRSSTSCRSIVLGIEARSSGRSSRTRSVVSMMLAFGCRLMITSTEDLPLAIPALRRSSTESTTSATSERRTAEPLRYATMSGMYWLAFFAWSSAMICQWRSSSSTEPLGRLALAPASAARTSSSPIAYLLSVVGFSSTRTAGSEAPPTVT